MKEETITICLAVSERHYKILNELKKRGVFTVRSKFFNKMIEEFLLKNKYIEKKGGELSETK